MNFADAISGIESGGRYDLLGPETHGDRAYGRYQIMGANIGPWTQKYLGHALTPQQFLADPAAQDAVFQARFINELVPKYGPAGAARAWFAGEGGMNNPNAKDVLGTSVAGYERRFMSNLGAGQTPRPQPQTVGSVFTSFAPSLPALPELNLTPPEPKAQPAVAQGGSPVLHDPALEPRAFTLARMRGKFARTV